MMRNAIILIAIVLIGLMITGPSLMSGLGDLGDKLSDWVKYGFEDGDTTTGDGDKNGGPTNGDNVTEPLEDSEGQVCMGVTVQFKDGTQHTVGPDDVVFTLFPLTIFFEGKEVSAIRFKSFMLVDWSGELNSFRVDGYMQIETGKSEEEIHGVLKHLEINKVYGDEMPRNEWFCVADMIIEADHIEVLGSGEWVLRGYVKVDVEAVFPRSTDTRNATAKAHLPISIQLGTLTVFSVEIQPQVLNP